MIRLLRDDLAQRSLDLPLERLGALVDRGGTMEGLAETARQHGAVLPSDWVDRFYEILFAGLAREVGAIAGASALLDHLMAAGIKMAVGSNGPRAKMEITLRRCGLIDRLQPHIYSARDLAHPKPAPDVFLHAARQLGVAASECVVVEDSLSGAQAARAAGMRCIGYAPPGATTDLSGQCDLVVREMGLVARCLGV